MARSKKAQAAIDGALSVPCTSQQVTTGVDLLEIERMRKVLKRTPSFKNKVFTESEIEYCESRPDIAPHYAVRFAAKEAVSKALGTGFTNGITFKDIEVIREDGKRPIIKLYGNALLQADKLSITQIPISLSHTSNEAIACAIAITKDSKFDDIEKVDPTKKLIQQFKEAKAILDDLGKLDLK